MSNFILPQDPRAFEGDWKVEKLPFPQMSSAEKMKYYPPEDQILTFILAGDHPSMGPKPEVLPYFKVKAQVPDLDWDGRIPLENAIFLFVDGILTSTQMPTEVNMPTSRIKQTIHEAIMLGESDDSGVRTMTHTIIWQDYDHGRWGCTGQ